MNRYKEGQGLALRMYSLVLYQFSGIQAGIQSGHSNSEYGVDYGLPADYLDWKRNHKTVIVLNGGSSTSLTGAIGALAEANIEHTVFREPDLYNVITSVSFIVDERVFDKEKYPDLDLISYFGKDHKYDEIDLKEIDERKLKWLESIGGTQNEFLRSFLKNFRLF